MVTVTEATITCPECGYASSETMPTNACQCKSVHDVVSVNAAEWCENELHLLCVPAVPEDDFPRLGERSSSSPPVGPAR